jgi:hypothetical protein
VIVKNPKMEGYERGRERNRGIKGAVEILCKAQGCERKRWWERESSIF